MNLCRNCHRHKLMVAKRRRPDADAEVWRVQLYCIDCYLMPCPDYGPGPEDKCELPQAVQELGADPPTWLGWCRKHHYERTICQKRRCSKPKPVWDTLCPECRAKTDATFHRRRKSQLRKFGDLCPHCKWAPINHPQRWCVSCLRDKGITPMKLNTSPLEAERRRDAVVAKQAKRHEEYLRRKKRKAWQARKETQASQRRARRSTVNVAKLLKALPYPNADERESMGLDPTSTAPILPDPKPKISKRSRTYIRPRTPRQKKWKPAYWTGYGKTPYPRKPV